MSAKSALSIFAVFLVVASVAGFLSQKLKPESQVPATVANAETPKVASVDVHSIYGDMNANINEITQSSGNKIYTVTLSELKDGGEKTVLLQTAYPQNASLSLPPNAWSPENDYIFLKETTASGSSFLVYKANGEALTSETKYMNVSKGFAAKGTGYNLVDVTGWDSPTLLHIKAKNAEGAKANYWYEVPSGSVIRLSR